MLIILFNESTSFSFFLLLFLLKIQISRSEFAKHNPVAFEPNNFTSKRLFEFFLIKLFILLNIVFIIFFSSSFGIT